MEIRDKDVVAGWFFRKFIQDYKDYDIKQKEHINSQRKEINKLKKKLAVYEAEIPDDNLKNEKIRNQAVQIQTLDSKIKEQQIEIERLKTCIERLTKK